MNNMNLPLMPNQGEFWFKIRTPTFDRRPLIFIVSCGGSHHAGEHLGHLGAGEAAGGIQPGLGAFDHAVGDEGGGGAPGPLGDRGAVGEAVEQRGVALNEAGAQDVQRAVEEGEALLARQRVVGGEGALALALGDAVGYSPGPFWRR